MASKLNENIYLDREVLAECAQHTALNVAYLNECYDKMKPLIAYLSNEEEITGPEYEKFRDGVAAIPKAVNSMIDKMSKVEKALVQLCEKHGIAQKRTDRTLQESRAALGKTIMKLKQQKA